MKRLYIFIFLLLLRGACLANEEHLDPVESFQLKVTLNLESQTPYSLYDLFSQHWNSLASDELRNDTMIDLIGTVSKIERQTAVKIANEITYPFLKQNYERFCQEPSLDCDLVINNLLALVNLYTPVIDVAQKIKSLTKKWQEPLSTYFVTQQLQLIDLLSSFYNYLDPRSYIGFEPKSFYSERELKSLKGKLEKLAKELWHTYFNNSSTPTIENQYIEVGAKSLALLASAHAEYCKRLLGIDTRTWLIEQLAKSKSSTNINTIQDDLVLQIALEVFFEIEARLSTRHSWLEAIANVFGDKSPNYNYAYSFIYNIDNIAENFIEQFNIKYDLKDADKMFELNSQSNDLPFDSMYGIVNYMFQHLLLIEELAARYAADEEFETYQAINYSMFEIDKSFLHLSCSFHFFNNSNVSSITLPMSEVQVSLKTCEKDSNKILTKIKKKMKSKELLVEYELPVTIAAFFAGMGVSGVVTKLAVMEAKNVIRSAVLNHSLRLGSVFTAHRIKRTLMFAAFEALVDIPIFVLTFKTIRTGLGYESFTENIGQAFAFGVVGRLLLPFVGGSIYVINAGRSQKVAAVRKYIMKLARGGMLSTAAITGQMSASRVALGNGLKRASTKSTLKVGKKFIGRYMRQYFAKSTPQLTSRLTGRLSGGLAGSEEDLKN
ncbi:MAG: hypothetical protein KDD40_04705 [Bdellovibrionales bacterium]|nr:hypothetical protein [Bdellovibrionales bacterium]